MMREHAAHGAAMRDGVARGDLELARREARVLAELWVQQANVPAWQANLHAMNVAAADVAEAKDLAAASRALARVGRACGDCHAANIAPSVHVGDPPDERVEVVPAMKRHQWAAVRLWYGLIFPSSAAWGAGARALAEAPLNPGLFTPGKIPVPEIAELDRSVHYLADRANSAASVGDRELVYGELMSTCSACHLRLGGGPPGASQR